MSVFSLLKKIDRALHINKLRYYLMNKKYSINQFFAIKKMCHGADFIMINTPDHGNLGDQAIALAEERFFKDKFPNVEYRELSGDYYRKNYRILKMIVSKKVVLGISGGGYIGDVWMDEEELVRNVIETFPDNKIIIFPQTVYYHDNPAGMKEWECTKKLLVAHADTLYFCLRDQRSYDFICKNIPELKNIYYFPDMALSLNIQFNEERKGILTCFRSDQEKVLSDEVIQKLYSYAEDNDLKLSSTTTVYEKNVSTSEREQEVFAKLKEFASAKLVITDRLHAMIFAAITGTPCIAFDNKTRKISGVYEWIKNLCYVSYISGETSIEKVTEAMKEMLEYKDLSFELDNNEWKLFIEVLNNILVF